MPEAVQTPLPAERPATGMSASPRSTPPPADRLALCSQCDWLMRLPERAPGQSAHCPRCGHHVAEARQRDVQRPLAWGIAALILLGLVFAFDFLGFSTHGISRHMHFSDAAHALLGDDYPSLAILLMATTVVLPGVYLAVLVYLCAGARLRQRLPGAVRLARTLRPLEPWMMSDVFIVGVLVSLIKIVTLADIHIELSFWAFCGYAVCLLCALSQADWTSLWDTLAPPPAIDPRARPGASGRSQRLMACRACATPFTISADRRCPRCGKPHRSHGLNRLQLTWSLIATSAILYIPANVYPILSITQFGNAQPQTIIAGVVHLAEAGSWPIALVIFTASIVVPVSKILALAWLCLASRGRGSGDPAAHTRLYRFTEKIGRWSMIDVFVVAVLGALVQAGRLMSFAPGPGALAFAAVVVLTMIAALTFDTRLLWPDFPMADHAPDDKPI